MGTIKRFEDIRAWKSARQLVNKVYDITNQGNFAKDFALRDQIRRAAGSSMHNIAEGFDAGSDAEFLRFLGYARRSASEIQSQLYTALDQNYINQKSFQTIYQQGEQVKRQINAFITDLHKSKSSKQIKEPDQECEINPSDHLDQCDQSDHLDQSDQSDQSDQ